MFILYREQYEFVEKSTEKHWLRTIILKGEK